MKKGYCFRIYPTDSQKEFLAKNFGCCRYVFNRGLSEAKLEYENWLALKEQGVINLSRPISTGYDFVKRLPIYKADPICEWLKEAIATALQQEMLHLGTAYSNFFRRRIGYPRFKKKEGRQTFSLMRDGFQIRNGQFTIAKCDNPIKIEWHRELPSAPSSLTIIKRASGKYYVCFICEYEFNITKGTKITGIDAGLTSLFTFSDGTKIDNPHHTKKYALKLKRAQQSLARKVKGSHNRKKACLKVSTIHQHIANARQDHLHKLSRILVDENQVIGLEALVPSNMVKNYRLAKHISDAAWSTFKTFVIYKAQESGHCSVVVMDAYYPSSHICSSCQQRLDRKLKLSERTWTCPHCHQTHDRDVNAAINIRDEAAIAYHNANEPKGIVLLANNKR